MTAAEAKVKALEAAKQSYAGSFNQIILSIQAEVSLGKFELQYYKSISQEVIDLLKENGYQVKDYGYDQRDDIYLTIISWR